MQGPQPIQGGNDSLPQWSESASHNTIRSISVGWPFRSERLVAVRTTNGGSRSVITKRPLTADTQLRERNARSSMLIYDYVLTYMVLQNRNMLNSL